MNLEITNRPKFARSGHECIMVLRWYSAKGSLFMEFCGDGSTPEEAENEARLHLGQGRAKLNELTAAAVESNGRMADALGASV
jgi:hypothetical protein